MRGIGYTAVALGDAIPGIVVDVGNRAGDCPSRAVVLFAGQTQRRVITIDNVGVVLTSDPRRHALIVPLIVE